jgi:hypothetical protein
MTATTGHSILTQDHMGKYRNIFFSEAIAPIEPKLHQSLEGPLQTSCFLCWSEFQDDYYQVNDTGSWSLWFFFFWLLCFLFFFDIWIPITPLVSSNSSCLLATLHRPLNSTIYCFYHINLWGFLEPNRDFQCGTCTKKGTHLQTLILHIPFNRSHSTCNLHVLYYTNCMKSSTFLDS